VSQPTVRTDVFGYMKPFDVKCHAKGAKLEIETVTFHGLSDEQFVEIRDAIDGYLSRKKLRELRDRTTAGSAAPEATK
jgi:hypothetical protein